MKQRKLLVLVLSILAFIILPAVVQGADAPRLRLSLTALNLAVDQEITVDVLVEEATSIYGTEIRLLFDPGLLEVTELSHGDFLSADPDNEAFVLENEANNEVGTVDYALALLNPAPPAEGSGLLLQVTFKAKGEGATTIQIEDGLFGTQTGEEVVPTWENVEVMIGNGGRDSDGNRVAPAQLDDASGSASEPVARRTEDRTEENSGMWLGLGLIFGGFVIVVVGLVGVALLIGVWFWLSRSKQRKRPQQAPS